MNSVGKECPNLGGKAVLQAQLFLEYILNQPANWSTNCTLPQTSFRKTKQVNKPSISNQLYLEDYLTITPNPAADYFKFNFAPMDYPKSVEILDVAGKSIRHTSIINTSNRIDVADLHDGTYLLVFNLASGNKVFKKLFIAK